MTRYIFLQDHSAVLDLLITVVCHVPPPPARTDPSPSLAVTDWRDTGSPAKLHHPGHHIRFPRLGCRTLFVVCLHRYYGRTQTVTDRVPTGGGELPQCSALRVRVRLRLSAHLTRSGTRGRSPFSAALRRVTASQIILWSEVFAAQLSFVLGSAGVLASSSTCIHNGKAHPSLQVCAEDRFYLLDD